MATPGTLKNPNISGNTALIDAIHELEDLAAGRAVLTGQQPLERSVLSVMSNTRELRDLFRLRLQESAHESCIC